MRNIREANGLFLKLTSDVCVGVRLRMWLFLCQQVGPWVTFLSKEERETSVCSVYCETTGLIRAHGPFVECIGLLLLSVVSELLFYSTITPYRTVTLLCINLHLLILHLRVVPLLFHHLPSAFKLSPSYSTIFYIRMRLCVRTACAIFSLM